MNPQYMPPTQPPFQQQMNNNAPPNPQVYPPSAMNNSHQNANTFSQYPNGPIPSSQLPPTKTFDQNAGLNQTMHNLHLGPTSDGFTNGPPAGFSPGQIPSGQLPPLRTTFQSPQPGMPPISQGIQGPPVSSNQRPPSVAPASTRPSDSGTPGAMSMMSPSQPINTQNSLPPTASTPSNMQSGLQAGIHPLPKPIAQLGTLSPGENQSIPSQQVGPPTSLQDSSVQSGQTPPQIPGPPAPGHMPPKSSQFPPHSGASQHPPTQFPQPQSGQLSQQPNQLSSQLHQQNQLPSQPKLFSQPAQSPLQPGQLPLQPSQLPPQPGPLQQGQLPPLTQQPGQLSQQQGQIQQPGQMPPQSRLQSGQLPPQPGPMKQIPLSGQLPPGPFQQLGQQQGQFPPQQGPIKACNLPQQSGQLPPQPGQLPSQLGQLPPQPGQLPPQPGQLPPHPGQLPPGSGQLPPGSGQLPPGPGQLPPGSGQLPPGQLPSKPGQLPPGSGQFQPGFSQLPPGPGQLPPGPGQLPPGPGQLPTGPGQLPPGPGQLPPGPGQLPPGPGQYAGSGSQPPTQFGSGFQQSHNQFPGQPGPPGPPMGHSYQAQQQPSMPGLPHMPPPGGAPGQPGQGYPPQPGYGAGKPGGVYPGMPPMPGGGQLPAGYSQQAPFPAQQPSYPGAYQQQQPKRLDPEQMPSPIQVMADDQQNRGGVFVTNDKGLVPPLVTTDFIVDDQGNSSPRFIRSSMYSIPATPDMIKQTSLPFCLVISPMAEVVHPEQEPPVLDFALMTNSPAMGPVRCVRCKAYMCPAMKFIDAGRHFKCAFCKATTEVPMEYTQYINSMQQYGRMPAEMSMGTYEIVATKEYCRNNTLPKPPALVFLIDVSYNANRCGLVQVICNNMRRILDSIPRDDSTGKAVTRVGFITYSSTIHFYNIKGTLAQPQMMSVGDVADVFVPLLEGFLCTLDESSQVIDSLAEQIPRMFQDTRETETILLPAVQAGLEALKAADTAGQLLVFHTSLPTAQAPGKLNNRDDRKLLGTDKEKQILSPQTTAYNELGQLCANAGCSVELFLANSSYVDVATIGQLSRLTGGGINKYTYFTADTDGDRFLRDLSRVLSRPTAYDAVMRVRTSTGVRATDFYGHFFMSNTTDVELAAVDADKAIGVEIKHDDKLTGEEAVHVQVALLYTRRDGQRRLRVLNLALAVAHQLADVYRACDLDTLINFLTKQALWALRDATPRAVRDALVARAARSLAAYRRHCASPSSQGQLVLPESCKLMPLYISCLLRSDAVSGGPDITCDDRSCAMARALTADVESSVVQAYPRLLPLHEMRDGDGARVHPLRCSVEKLRDDGVYLLENGVHMLLWVGSQAPPEFCSQVFGVPAPGAIDPQVAELPVLDNPLSVAVRGIIEDARTKRRRCMRLTIMRQHDKLEAVLRHFLVEDRGVDGSASYVDFLCHVHKEIRQLL